MRENRLGSVVRVIHRSSPTAGRKKITSEAWFESSTSPTCTAALLAVNNNILVILRAAQASAVVFNTKIENIGSKTGRKKIGSEAWSESSIVSDLPCSSHSCQQQYLTRNNAPSAQASAAAMPDAFFQHQNRKNYPGHHKSIQRFIIVQAEAQMVIPRLLAHCRLRNTCKCVSYFQKMATT